MNTLTAKPGPKFHPVCMVRIRLCGCHQTDWLKAYTEDGRHFEITERHPLWRGAVLERKDLEIRRPTP